MMRAPELRHWLRACGARGGTGPCVIVPGGGVVADHVRELQAAWTFDEQLAHELALDAMRMNAKVLEALLPGARLTSGLEASALAAPANGAWVWSPPQPFCAELLPASWAATADSIALWLAQRLDAGALFLVKSVAAEALVEASAATLAGRQLIDDFFPHLLLQQPVPVRILAKSQYAEFEQARARQLLCGMRVRWGRAGAA